MDGSQLFVVRVWSERARFRASVRAVDREETTLFDEPTELAQFLRAASIDAPATRRPEPPDEGTT